MTLKSL